MTHKEALPRWMTIPIDWKIKDLERYYPVPFTPKKPFQTFVQKLRRIYCHQRDLDFDLDSMTRRKMHSELGKSLFAEIRKMQGLIVSCTVIIHKLCGEQFLLNSD